MKPIIFSTPMVQAILEGRKTQTRRVIKPQPKFVMDGELIYGDAYPARAEYLPNDYHLAPYQPGDILYVREAWNLLYGFTESEWKSKYPNSECPADREYIYKADYSDMQLRRDADAGIKWRPPNNMPREAARIFLRVADVRAERVQDIMTIDAIAEGCAGLADIESGGWEIRPEEEFSVVWDSIYAKRGHGWNENPFCWVYTFVRVEETQNE